jgi:hypothetical protein
MALTAVTASPSTQRRAGRSVLLAMADLMGTTTTRDVLERARDSLMAGPFSFHDWTECTCGHLFVGAQGTAATSRSEVRSPREGTPYAAAVVEIAGALAGDEGRFATRRHWYDRRSGARLAVRWISDLTMSRARARQDIVRRADALAVLDKALARVPGDVHERRLVA